MNENYFSHTMSSKTEDELKAVIKNESLVADACQAANWELEKRALIKTEVIEPVEKTNLEPRKKTNFGNEWFTFRRKQSFITIDPKAPELYSKQAILLFSILFSTIFGAVLLMSNLKTLRLKNARNQVLWFGIMYTGIIIFIVSYFEIKSNIGMPLNLVGSLILTELFWNRELGKEFSFRKKKIREALFYSILIMIPFVLVVIYG